MKPARLLLVAGTLAGCAERVEVEAPRTRAMPEVAWENLLTRAAGPDGVDYELLAENRAVLRRFLSWCGEHGPDSDSMRESAEDRRIAFLVNAYNAAVLEGVLRHRPIDSVQDVRIGLYPSGGAGFFLGQRFWIDGEWIDLYHLEKQYIVARYQEPLLHVTLNCASRSCPPVRWWEASGLQQTLSSTLANWLEAGGAMVEEGDGWAVNEIFWWYEDDFLEWSDAANLCQWLAPHAVGPRRTWLDGHAGDCPLGRIPYDWSLNAAPAR